MSLQHYFEKDDGFTRKTFAYDEQTRKVEKSNNGVLVDSYEADKAQAFEDARGLGYDAPKPVPVYDAKDVRVFFGGVEIDDHNQTPDERRRILNELEDAWVQMSQGQNIDLARYARACVAVWRESERTCGSDCATHRLVSCAEAIMPHLFPHLIREIRSTAPRQAQATQDLYMQMPFGAIPGPSMWIQQFRNGQ